MPIYTYDCEKCSTTVEHITSYAERDVPMGCLEPDYDGQGQCGGKLVRRGVELFTKGEPSFQTHAITTSGKKVAGNFGKTARKAKGWHRP